MIIISVYNRNSGKPVSQVKVSTNMNVMTRYGFTSAYTDSNGTAYLATDPCSDGEVFIDGRKVHSGRITAEMSFTV